MKKSFLTLVFFIFVTAFGYAQENKTSSQPEKVIDKTAEKTAATSENDEFQNRKAAEARQKQEEKRKAMKEKAKNKVETEMKK